MYDPAHHFLRQLQLSDVEAPEGADLAMALPVDPTRTNPRGGLQGGLVATLVDVTAGRAALARAGAGKTVPTSDLHLRFLSPITVGPAVAVATVVRQGRTLIVVDVAVTDAGRDDALAATASLAFSVLEARPGQAEPVTRVFPAPAG